MTDRADAIVEEFRSAAIGIADWTTALSNLAHATGARIAQLGAYDRFGDLTFNHLAGTSEDEAAAYFASGGPDPAVNPRTRAILAAPDMRCVNEQDFATPAMIDRTPIYRDLFRWSDVPYSSQIRLAPPTGLVVILGMHRSRSSGHATPDDTRLLAAVAPHISSAVKSGVAVNAMLERTVLETAERVSGPAILLGDGLRVIALSPAAESVVQAGRYLRVRLGRLSAVDDAGTAELNHACRAVTARRLTGPGSVPVILRTTTGAPPIIAEVYPLPARMSGGLCRARVLLTIDVPRPADCLRLKAAAQARFALTNAEADVAALLAGGCALSAIAERRGTTLGTVRTQVKALFEKTGTHRQAELVLQLAALR